MFEHTEHLVRLSVEALGAAVIFLGLLAAIAVIRTALNYFLMQEMKEEERNPGRALP